MIILYVGVYIPTLTKELLDDPLAKDPTGIFVGDPCTDDDTQIYNLVDELTHYAYDFGFMTPENYDILQSSECTAVQEQIINMLAGAGTDKTDYRIDWRIDGEKKYRKKARFAEVRSTSENSKKARSGDLRRPPPENRKLRGSSGAAVPPQTRLERALQTAATKQLRGMGLSKFIKKCAAAFYEGSFGSSHYYWGGGLDVYGVFNPW